METDWTSFANVSRAEAGDVLVSARHGVARVRWLDSDTGEAWIGAPDGDPEAVYEAACHRGCDVSTLVVRVVEPDDDAPEWATHFAWPGGDSLC